MTQAEPGPGRGPRGRGRLRATVDFWVAPGDLIRLDSFRVCFGVVLLLFACKWGWHATEWLGASGFHVSRSAHGFLPVLPPLPDPAVPLFMTLFLGAIAAWILGWRLRVTSPLLLLCTIYVTLVDPVAAFTMNRNFILTLIVFSLAPSGGNWSVEPGPPRAGSIWPIRVLQTLVLAQYLANGLCKALFGAWLDDPFVLWAQAQGWYTTEIASLLYRVLPLGVWAWMQYLALTFELFGPFLFLFRRLRILVIPWGIGFHLMIALTMEDLIFFSIQLMSYYVLFLDESLLHRVRDEARRALAWLSRGRLPARNEGPPSPAALPGRARAVHVAIVAIFLVFFVLPLLYRNTTGRRPPLLYRSASFQYLQSISCLFRDAPKAWASYYLQVRERPGAPWVEVPRGEVFQMKLFGHTTKLEELFRKGIVLNVLAQDEIASWVRDRYARLHPGRAAPEGVRVVVVEVPIRSVVPGKWVRPPLEKVSAARKTVFFEREF